MKAITIVSLFVALASLAALAKAADTASCDDQAIQYAQNALGKDQAIRSSSITSDSPSAKTLTYTVLAGATNDSGDLSDTYFVTVSAVDCSLVSIEFEKSRYHL
jgi:hypothetical protein